MSLNNKMKTPDVLVYACVRRNFKSWNKNHGQETFKVRLKTCSSIPGLLLWWPRASGTVVIEAERWLVRFHGSAETRSQATGFQGVNDQSTEGEQKHYICMCVYVYKHFTYFQVYLFTLKSLKSLDRWKKPTLISEGSWGGGNRYRIKVKAPYLIQIHAFSSYCGHLINRNTFKTWKTKPHLFHFFGAVHCFYT